MTRLMMIAALSLIGLLSTLAALFATKTTPAACTAIGAIPVCEVLLGGYSVMFASTLIIGRSSNFTFLSGWLITLSLSLTALLQSTFSDRFAAPVFLISLAYFSASILLGAIWVRSFRRQIQRNRQ